MSVTFRGKGVVTFLIISQNLIFLLFTSSTIKMFISGLRWNYMI